MTAGRRTVVVPVVLAAGLLALGHPAPALLIVLATVVLTHLAAAAPERSARLDARIQRVAETAAGAVSTVALAVVWFLALAPVALLGRAFRSVRLGTGQWADRPSADDAQATDLFGPEPGGLSSRGVRLLGNLPLVVGWAAIAVAANYGIGWAWDEVTDSHEIPTEVALSPLDDPVELSRRPALVREPWARAHLDAYQSLEYEYWPFLLERVVDGTYGDIHVEDHERVTYEAPGLGSGAAEVWLLGGSTAFGRAQRDDHTIASALARLAEAEGRPLRVRNLADPGYTSYQEWLRLEQALAEPGEPDLVVVLDGTADLEVQHEFPSTEPTHFNRERVDFTVTGRGPTGETLGLGDLDDRYLDDSLVGRAWDRVSALFAVAPAGAEGPTIADNAADLGNRARRIMEHLAERDGVPVLFVREPEPIGGPTRAAYRAVTDRLEGTDVDLSGLLGGREELFVDWIHVNEEGARLVAEALWPEIGSRLG